MGLFKDRLFLRLTASAAPSGKLELAIDRIDKKSPNLLPFSCISLIGSQMTRLASPHVRSLSHALLDFIQDPGQTAKETGVVSGFGLEIYRNKDYLLYNQFDPTVGSEVPAPDANRLQADTVHAISNYVAAVYDGLSEPYRIKLLYFLLLTVSFYQQDIFPAISKINQLKPRKMMKKRKRLAVTELDILNTMYHCWKNEVRFLPGSTDFLEKLAEAKKFNSYLL